MYVNALILCVVHNFNSSKNLLFHCFVVLLFNLHECVTSIVVDTVILSSKVFEQNNEYTTIIIKNKNKKTENCLFNKSMFTCVS